jgi:hypothetical protein
MATSTSARVAQHASREAADVHTATFPLLDLPEGLMELVVSKLRASDSPTIRVLASTSHQMLQTVLECCSCLRYFDAMPDGDRTMMRCITRLDFRKAGGHPSRARLTGSLMPGNASARWLVYMPLSTLALVCADQCIALSSVKTRSCPGQQCVIPTAALPNINSLTHLSGPLPCLRV